MNEKLAQALARLQIQFSGQKKTILVIRNEEYGVPEPLQEFFGLLTGQLLQGPHLVYDRFHDEEISEGSRLWLTYDEIDLTEYEGLGQEPYVLFARNGYGSLFLIRLDDEQPDNPLVYYLDAEDYEEQPRVLTRSLTKTLAELPGVKKAELADGELQVKYDKDVVAWETIQDIAAETKQLRLVDLLKDAMAV